MAIGNSKLKIELEKKLSVLGAEQKVIYERLREIRREIIAIRELQQVNDCPYVTTRQDAVLATLQELGEASPKVIVRAMDIKGWVWHQSNPNQAVGAMLYHLCRDDANSVEKVSRGRYRIKTPEEQT